MVLLADVIWDKNSFHPMPWTIIGFYNFTLQTQTTAFIFQQITKYRLKVSGRFCRDAKKVLREDKAYRKSWVFNCLKEVIF